MSLKFILEDYCAQAAKGDPATMVEHYEGRTRQVQGLRSEGRFRGFTVVVDEPAEYGGTDAGPNPAELFLAAIGASIEVVSRVFADYHDIPLRGVSVRLAGDLPVAGFLALDDTPSRFTAIDIEVVYDSPATPAQLARLQALVLRCCPMLDAARHPVPVNLTFSVGPTDG